MEQVPATADASSSHLGADRRRSWVNQVYDWVDRFPGQYWFAYVVSALVLVLALAGVKWLDGVYPPLTFFPFHVYVAANPIWNIAWLDWARRSIAKGIDEIRPLIAATDQEVAQYRRQALELPVRATRWATVLGLASTPLLLVINNRSGSRLLVGSALTRIVDVVLFALIGCAAGLFVSQTIHLQRLISAVYDDCEEIDILKPQRLYTLAMVSVKAALVTIASLYAYMLALQSLDSERGISEIVGVLGVVVAAGFAATAAAIAILPLRGAHRHMRDQKRQMQVEAGDRIGAVIRRLYNNVDASDLSQSAALRDQLTSLELARTMIHRTSTWPWQPETPRLLATAIFLPLVVWIIQRVVGGFL